MPEIFSIETTVTPSLNIICPNVNVNLTGNPLVVGQDYVVGVSFASGNITTFINGVLISTSASTITALPWGTTSQIAIGQSTAFAARPSGTSTYWAGWWNTYLSASVHEAIGAGLNNIWQMFSRPGWLFRALSRVSPQPAGHLGSPPASPTETSRRPITWRKPDLSPQESPGRPGAAASSDSRRDPSHTRYVPPVLSFPPRYFPVPSPPTPAGCQPDLAAAVSRRDRSSRPAHRLQPQRLGGSPADSDTDPLAVNAGGAVQVSSDSDPIAVDPGGAVAI